MNYTSTFDGFIVCVTDIASYLSEHDNWRDPILVPETDCAELIYQGDDFQIGKSDWTC